MSEYFQSGGIVVTLEWTEVFLYTYYISVLPPIPFMQNGNSTVVFSTSYNTTYNVSIVAEYPCGKNVTFYSQLLQYCKYTHEVRLILWLHLLFDCMGIIRHCFPRMIVYKIRFEFLCTIISLYEPLHSM